MLYIFSSFYLELCLTSNIKCRTVPSYASHQFKYFHEAGHPITIGVSIWGKYGRDIHISR